MDQIQVQIPNFYGKPTIDHKDRNKNNNSLYNLRWANRDEQQRNRGISYHNTSGVIGVYYRENRWVAQLKIHGITHKKSIKTKEEAIAQRLELEKIYH